jgi:hypothetical protein
MAMVSLSSMFLDKHPKTGLQDYPTSIGEDSSQPLTNATGSAAVGLWKSSITK